LIVEHARYGDLESVLEVVDESCFHVEHILPLLLKWMFVIAEALEVMHGLYLTHSDVKPKNVLVFDRLEVKLADLGSVVVHHQDPDCASGLQQSDGESDLSDEEQGGTLGYMPLLGVGTSAGDMFSFGMTCVHIINRRRLQQAWQNDIQQAKRTLVSMDNENVSNILIDFIDRCTDVHNPSHRPTAGECKQILTKVMAIVPVVSHDLIDALEREL
jgi:serine/threonine protein kinase